MEICNSFKICPNLPVSDSLGLQMIEVFSDLLFLRCLILCRLLSHAHRHFQRGKLFGFDSLFVKKMD